MEHLISLFLISHADLKLLPTPNVTLTADSSERYSLALHLPEVCEPAYTGCALLLKLVGECIVFPVCCYE